jgi:nucleotide-binding universal stress UspA family protein
VSAAIRLEKILFPMDFSDLSGQAEDYAISLAERFHASIFLLHVIEPIERMENDDADLRSFYSKLEKSAQGRLEEAQSRIQKAGIQVSWRITLGHRWVDILRRAVDVQADLIIMGTHGLRAVQSHPTMATTSQRVALLSPCPVVLIPAGAGSDDDPLKPTEGAQSKVLADSQAA